MDTLICLVGPSGTGKTSVAYTLQQRYGYNVIESYTTRPPRYAGEKGHTFTDRLPMTTQSSGCYLDLNVIAYNQYNGHHYWATREQYRGKGVSIYVVDVPGVDMLRRTVRDAGIIVVALWANRETRRQRMNQRSADITNIEERLRYDDDAFAVIPCDYTVDATPDLDTVVGRVASIIKSAISG